MRSFAYAVPVSSLRNPIASLVLAGPHGSARRDASSLVSANIAGGAQVRPAPNALPPRVRATAGGVSLAWNAQRYPLVVVRDAHSGEILSFARNGVAQIETPSRDLELTLSDGVQSTVVQSHVAP